jgi:predicted ATP-dependent endonuclease of OLD family
LISELAIWQKTAMIELGRLRKWEVNLFMLEEPELGIHPHQLQLLMNYIKAQAKEKQIILTTHSPQVFRHFGNG